MAIDQTIIASNVAGIEVYAQPTTALTEYQVVNTGCSIILIWTKGGAG